MKKNAKKTDKRARKLFAKGKSKNVAKPALNDDAKAKKQKAKELKRAKILAKKEKAKAKAIKAKERAAAKKAKAKERAKKLRLKEQTKKQKARAAAKKAKLLAREKAKKAAQATKAKVAQIKERAKKAVLKEREKTAKEKAKVKALAAKAKKMKTIIPANDTKKLSPKEAALAMKSTLKAIADQLATLQADQRAEEIASLGKLGYEAAISGEGVLTVHFAETKTKKLKIEKKLKDETETSIDDVLPPELSDEGLDKIIDEGKDLFGDPEGDDIPQEIPAGDLFATDGEIVEDIDADSTFAEDNDDETDDDDGNDKEDDEDEDDDSIDDHRDDDDNDKIAFRQEWNNEFDDDGERTDY